MQENNLLQTPSPFKTAVLAALLAFALCVPCAAAEFSIVKVSQKRIKNAISHTAGGGADTVTGYQGLETEFENIELPPAKLGEKFCVKWKCRLPRASKKSPAEGCLRMEFFTETTGLLLTQDQKVEIRRGTFRNVFRHTGKSFADNGRVTHWRFSLLDADGNVLCGKSSPMWDTLPAIAIKQKTVWKPAPAAAAAACPDSSTKEQQQCPTKN